MAKSKNEEVEVKEINWQEIAKFNEAKANDALLKVMELEDFLAELMPDLHLSAKYFHSVQVAAGGRMEKAFHKVRDLLGERGIKIDKQMRGQ